MQGLHVTRWRLGPRQASGDRGVVAGRQSVYIMAVPQEQEYRLLSEAEREYMTRAGTTTPYWWGSLISTSEANYDGNYTYGPSPKGEYRKQTVSVDSFKPNPWGLYQVHGNVFEWY